MIAAGVLLGINSVKANHLSSELLNHVAETDTTRVPATEKQDTIRTPAYTWIDTSSASVIADTAEPTYVIVQDYAGIIDVTSLTPAKPKRTPIQKVNAFFRRMAYKLVRHKE